MTARARQRGLREGWSLNKTVVDPITGRNWDLLNSKDVKAAWNLFCQTQPKLLVTFPHCEPDGEFMIELAIDMGLAQAKAERYFAFECAELVNCWHLPYVLRLYSVQNAHKIVLVTDSGERRIPRARRSTVLLVWDNLVPSGNHCAMPWLMACWQNVETNRTAKVCCTSSISIPACATQTKSVCRVLTTLPGESRRSSQ